METGNKLEIQQHLTVFKDRGIVLFDKTLAISHDDRIPMLINQPDGYMRVASVLTASLKSAFDSINLRIGFTEDQVIELAGLIIETSTEDYLSLEDVLLFLHELLTGKAGKIYDRLDIPTFFELFENYRQKRHEALQEIRYEQSVNYKSLGPDREDGDVDRSKHREALGEYLKDLYKDEKS